MTSANLLPMLATFVVGYFLGSIPWGLLLTRAAGLGDVRALGSGNIGATNVLRTGSKKLAALTLFLDGLKGYVAVVVAGMIIAPWLLAGSATAVGPTVPPAHGIAEAAALALQRRLSFYEILAQSAGLDAFLGHIYPAWLGFRGGKGVATYIGVLLGLAWKLGFGFCGVWLIVAYLFRYSSLAALVAAVVTPVFFLGLGATHLAVLFALMTVLLFYKHKANIERLMQGTESKIGDKSTSQESS